MSQVPGRQSKQQKCHMCKQERRALSRFGKLKLNKNRNFILQYIRDYLPGFRIKDEHKICALCVIYMKKEISNNSRGHITSETSVDSSQSKVYYNEMNETSGERRTSSIAAAPLRDRNDRTSPRRQAPQPEARGKQIPQQVTPPRTVTQRPVVHYQGNNKRLSSSPQAGPSGIQRRRIAEPIESSESDEEPVILPQIDISRSLNGG